jgi:formylglycine-generating enzyme required for sulfatase activity/DNA-directed RNA polymerase subunit RPC12/RpoP
MLHSNFEEAIKCYDKALEIDSRYYKAWNNKGIALHKQGKIEESIKCYDKALEIVPEHKESLHNKEYALRNYNIIPPTRPIHESSAELEILHINDVGSKSEKKPINIMAPTLKICFACGNELEIYAEDYIVCNQCGTNWFINRSGDKVKLEDDTEFRYNLKKSIASEVTEPIDTIVHPKASSNSSDVNIPASKVDRKLYNYEKQHQSPQFDRESNVKIKNNYSVKDNLTVFYKFILAIIVLLLLTYAIYYIFFSKVNQIPTETRQFPTEVYQSSPPENTPITSINSFIEPDMVYIASGTFEMGSNNGDKDEKPVHSVTVNRFYMGKYEITNKEYCIYDSSHDNPGDNLPVVNVSWNDAAGYCKWLIDITGKAYRLPTEAEWEYACRAGTTTEYFWGDKMDDSYCWYNGNSGGKVHQVGKKLPNAFGLYDMSGNVCEWCSDWYGDYSTKSVIDPIGLLQGSFRVLRGGSWNCNTYGCRLDYRNHSNPNSKRNYIGFRLVRSETKTVYTDLVTPTPQVEVEDVNGVI